MVFLQNKGKPLHIRVGIGGKKDCLPLSFPFHYYLLWRIINIVSYVQVVGIVRCISQC